MCVHAVCLHSPIHSPAHATAFRSTLWFLPLQAPSPSVLCDRTPAVRRSFNERSTWERRNEEQGEEKDFMGLYFFLQRCHLCRVKRCKAPSLCGGARLALISIAITPQTQKKKKKKRSDALARGGTHPNTPRHTRETVLTAHELSIYHFLYQVKKKKKKKQMGVLHSMLPSREYPLFPLFSLISSALLSLFSLLTP